MEFAHFHFRTKKNLGEQLISRECGQANLCVKIGIFT